MNYQPLSIEAKKRLVRQLKTALQMPPEVIQLDASEWPNLVVTFEAQLSRDAYAKRRTYFLAYNAVKRAAA